MKYWLMKTEPETFSIDDLEREGTTQWEGIRNYQARNFLRDEMSVGDAVLIYHSSTTPPGIVGLAMINSEAAPDPFAFKEESKYYDPKSTKEKPIWVVREVKFVKKFKAMLTLESLKSDPILSEMLVIRKGMRLSIQPVTEKEYKHIVNKSVVEY